MTRISVRDEEPRDYTTIRKILIDAFAHHPFSRQTEHLIVEELRAAKAMTFGLVAELDGVVAGHIAFSPMLLDGKECDWFILGPIAVTPGLQRKGVGKALMNEGLNRLRNLGADGCFLVGYPAYYPQFGFRNDPTLFMEGVTPDVTFSLPLKGRVPKGKVTHHKAFNIGPECCMVI